MKSLADQSSFLSVTKTIPGGNLTTSLVSEVSYSVSSRFVRGVYDSCKDVVSPATSGIGLISLMIKLLFFQIIRNSELTMAEYIGGLLNNSCYGMALHINEFKLITEMWHFL